MSKKPYLLFDAGGTLIFPNHALTAEIAQESGLEVTAQDLAAAHAQLFRDFDQHVAEKRRFPAIQYYPELYKRLTQDAEKARAAAEATLAYDRQRSLWSSTFPWVKATLEELQQRGYRMSVISNADGRVEDTMKTVGLREQFEIVIDSHLVGVEKPDRKIFNLALKELKLQPQEAIYIGDLFYIDVWGANQSGIGAIHLDNMDLYAGWAGVHLPSVGDLPDWLAHRNGNLQQENLYPAQDFEIN